MSANALIEILIEALIVFIVLCVSGLHGQDCNEPPDMNLLCCRTFITEAQQSCISRNQDELKELQKTINTITFRKIMELCPGLCVLTENSKQHIDLAASIRWGKELLEIVSQSFQRCLTSVNKQFRGSKKTLLTKCYSVNIYLDCLSNEMIANCPISLWIDSPQCNELKAYVRKCFVQTN